MSGIKGVDVSGTEVAEATLATYQVAYGIVCDLISTWRRCTTTPTAITTKGAERCPEIKRSAVSGIEGVAVSRNKEAEVSGISGVDVSRIEVAEARSLRGSFLCMYPDALP